MISSVNQHPVVCGKLRQRGGGCSGVDGVYPGELPRGLQFFHHVESLHKYLAETPDYGWLQLANNLMGRFDVGEVHVNGRKITFEKLATYEMTLPLKKTSAERYQVASSFAKNLIEDSLV